MRAFDAAGAEVVAIDIDKNALIEKSFPSRVMLKQADITDEDKLTQLLMILFYILEVDIPLYLMLELLPKHHFWRWKQKYCAVVLILISLLIFIWQKLLDGCL